MRYAVVVLIGILALSVSVANATTTTVTATFTGVKNAKAVHLKYGSQNLYVWAGLYEFEKQSMSPSSDENPAFYMGDEFGGYCIDIDQRISFDQTVIWTLKPLEEAPVVNGFGSAMGTDKATLLSRLWGSYFGDPNSAEFQVAVWELLAENDNVYDVRSGQATSGRFYATSDNEVDRGMINTWLAAITISDYNGPEASVIWALTNGCAQDFAVLIETGGQPPVPEPLTVAGLLMGCGFAVRYARKRASVR